MGAKLESGNKTDAGRKNTIDTTKKWPDLPSCVKDHPILKAPETLATGAEAVSIMASNTVKSARLEQQAKRQAGTNPEQLGFVQNARELLSPVGVALKVGDTLSTGGETVAIAASNTIRSANLNTRSFINGVRNWWNGK